MATSLDVHELVTCPAGEGINDSIRGPAVRCHIVHETITRDENSHSIQAFCAGRTVKGGGYQDCPIWRRMKEAEWERTGKQLERDINRSVPLPERPT